MPPKHSKKHSTMMKHSFATAVCRRGAFMTAAFSCRVSVLFLPLLLMCFATRADLVGYWSFSEGSGSIFHDGTTNHNDLTSHSPTFSTNTPYGAPGYSAHFNG